MTAALEFGPGATFRWPSTKRQVLSIGKHSTFYFTRGYWRCVSFYFSVFSFSFSPRSFHRASTMTSPARCLIDGVVKRVSGSWWALVIPRTFTLNWFIYRCFCFTARFLFWAVSSYFVLVSIFKSIRLKSLCAAFVRWICCTFRAEEKLSRLLSKTLEWECGSGVEAAGNAVVLVQTLRKQTSLSLSRWWSWSVLIQQTAHGSDRFLNYTLTIMRQAFNSD